MYGVLVIRIANLIKLFNKIIGCSIVKVRMPVFIMVFTFREPTGYFSSLGVRVYALIKSSHRSQNQLLLHCQTP